MADDSEPQQVFPNTKKPAIDPAAVEAAQIAAQNAEKRTATPAAPTNQQQVVNEDDCDAALRWADKAPPTGEAPPAKTEGEDRTGAVRIGDRGVYILYTPLPRSSHRTRRRVRV